MSDFKETCIWMSYRYAIGRKTIASVTHAADIAQHMDWVPENRWRFTAEDIFSTVNDSISFARNINLSFDGRRTTDAYSVLFEYLSQHPEYLQPGEFNRYDWDINLLTHNVVPTLRETPLAYGSVLSDYVDYKDWIRLAKLFLKNSKQVTVEYNGHTFTEECQEWWDCSVWSSGAVIEKRYSKLADGISVWYISSELIKCVQDV